MTAAAGNWLAAGLLLAWLVDRRWGEPPAAWHPVVWMGRYLAWFGRRLPALAPARAFAAGALGWWLGAAVVAVLAWGLQAALGTLFARAGWGGAIVAVAGLALVLKPLFAWRVLRDEVAAVEAALAGGTDAGRARLARLVSRDVSRLDAAEVRESAIESLAENLNDSVVAPLFWFALLGLPGAALYRFANTADAMWGYRDAREWSGKWAARADDALSWLPARLAAVLLLAAAAAPWRTWRRWPAEALHTPSPNGGHPMGAMALLLDVRLSKPGAYVLHPGARLPVPADTDRALRVAGRAAIVALAAAALAVALR